MDQHASLIPLVVIVGPTASGKSGLAIRLAKKYHGEIISADSRQVYKGLDIGSGKVTKGERKQIPHHLLDVVSPGRMWSLSHYKKHADRAILDIADRGKIPFLVGGTHLYSKAVLENYSLPTVRPNAHLRRRLEKKTLSQLQALLKRRDSLTYAHIDIKNSRRMIRALEVVEATGESFWKLRNKNPSRYAPLILGIDIPRKKLYEKIDRRVDERIRGGMVSEVERLISGGVSKKWLLSLGLEYRFVTKFLEEKERLQEKKALHARLEMSQNLKFAIHDFSRRQYVWYKKNEAIQWVRTQKEAEKLITRFLLGFSAPSKPHHE